MGEKTAEERVAAIKKKSWRDIGPPNAPMRLIWPGDEELVAMINSAIAAENERCAERAKLMGMEFFKEAWAAVEGLCEPQTALDTL